MGGWAWCASVYSEGLIGLIARAPQPPYSWMTLCAEFDNEMSVCPCSAFRLVIL